MWRNWLDTVEIVFSNSQSHFLSLADGSVFSVAVLLKIYISVNILSRGAVAALSYLDLSRVRLRLRDGII